MKILKRLLIAVLALSLFLMVLVAVTGGGDTATTTTVAAQTSSTSVVRPTTTTVPVTTTEAVTTTTAAPEYTIADVIVVTRARSANVYPDTLTWVDVNSDSDLADLADIICLYYESTGGDKQKTVTDTGLAYFSGYTGYVDADIDLYGYFAGGVIDVLCPAGTGA